MYQNDDYFKENNMDIYDSGCYFISLGYAAMDWSGIALHHTDVIEIYDACVDNRSMKENCFINVPGEVFNTWTKHLKSPQRATYIGRTKRGEDKYEPGWKKSDANCIMLHDITANGNYHFRYWSRRFSVRDPWFPAVEIKERIGYRYLNVRKV